ncbi:MAG TPA: hypothetical protein VJN93_18280 [Candidatus Acidoferrum sp.]|nr:hypothetical protein [Candidatus Acidoferrum sp.]
MTAEQRKLAYELITNPPPGSKLAAAKEWGVDLTLLYENLQLTIDERAHKLEEGANSLAALRAAARAHRAKR